MTILPQLERDLLEAAVERLPEADDPARGHGRHDRLRATPAARWPRGRRRLKAITASLPVLLSIVVAVLVAAIALTAFVHGHAPSSGEGSGSASSSRQELIQTLGVLRRPQAKSDLEAPLPLFFKFSARLGRRDLHHPTVIGLLDTFDKPEVDKPLLRKVRIAPLGIVVGIVPATSRPSAASARRLEGLAIALQGPGIGLPTGSEDDTGPRLTSVAVLRSQGLPLFTYARNGVNSGVVVVPDGVARVALGPFRLIHVPGSRRSPSIASATAAVRDNVAGLQLTGVTMEGLHVDLADIAHFFAEGTVVPRQHFSSAVYSIPAVAQMAWFDAAGKLITRSTIHLSLSVGLQHRGPGGLPHDYGPLPHK